MQLSNSQSSSTVSFNLKRMNQEEVRKLKSIPLLYKKNLKREFKENPFSSIEAVFNLKFSFFEGIQIQIQIQIQSRLYEQKEGSLCYANYHHIPLKSHILYTSNQVFRFKKIVNFSKFIQEFLA
jgi:hypothetical protein